ncbi:hypothetical protein OGAPHI_003848 [Ogataea philodendri]|uniref:CAP-Gly domain-containing protein n=1 Tax=Ogataea philodendri TaxID=1378263 RepID=A0A9P8T527_9ASCO|nr:uncharacterized protein OGAPHI_003848 [Ogataea philodendri]KAH3665660.1 hypothetical protein OGAPHI_003848 [Ogataea philodendri]
MLSPNDRVAVAGDLATVRFVGAIPNWPGETAVGIEWDVPERGKNDGTINGTRYFSTHNGAKSGSFVKAAKIDPTRSFMDAMVYQYASDESLALESDSLVDKFDLTIGTKKVESFGFERLSRLQADFSNLETATLERLNIAEAGVVGGVLDNLQVLSVGFNLLDWQNLMDIVVQLPNLHTLKANGNRWTRFGGRKQCTSVKTLHLSACALEHCSFKHELFTCFPNVTELYLSGNDLTAIELPRYTHLDLSRNKFTKLSELPPANILVASNNQLHIDTVNDTTIESLDITNTSVSEWSEVDRLRSLTSLRALRIINTPLVDSLDYDLATIQLFARLPTLQKLDGTDYTAAQRKSFELYFISKIRTREWACDTDLWTQLCSKHGVSSQLATQETTPIVPLTITLVHNGTSHTLTLSRSATVGKLRGRVSRLLGLGVLQFCLSTKLGIRTETLANDQQALRDLGISEPVTVDFVPWKHVLAPTRD